MILSILIAMVVIEYKNEQLIAHDPIENTETERLISDSIQMANNGQSDAAIKILRNKVLQTGQGRSGNEQEHSQLLMCIATINYQQRNFANAEDFSRQAYTLGLRSKSFKGRYEKSDVENLISISCFEQGKYREARQFSVKSVATVEEVDGKLSSKNISPLDTMLRIDAILGDHPNLKITASKLLAVQEIAFGNEDPTLIPALAGLLNVANHDRKYKEAKVYALRMLSIQERARGTKTLEIVPFLLALSKLHENLSEYMEAELLLRRVLFIQTNIAGPDEDATRQTLNELAVVLYYQRKFADAEIVAQQLLDSQIRILGENSEDLVPTYRLMGRLSARQSHDEATKYFYGKARSLQKK